VWAYNTLHFSISALVAPVTSQSGAAAGEPADEVPDMTYGFVGRFQAFFRALPLYAGGLGIAGLLANRALSGVGM
jgi:hypothetical protein